MGETFITIEQVCSPDGTICTSQVPSFASGDIVFTLALILFFQAMTTLGILFNTFIKKP